MNGPSNTRSTSPQLTHNGNADEELGFIEPNRIGSAKESCSDGSIRGDVYFRVRDRNNMMYHPGLKTFPERTEISSITTSQEAVFTSPMPLNGQHRKHSKRTTDDVLTIPRNPRLIIDTDGLRAKCKESLLKKAPELFIRRFEKCGYVLWDELSVLEKQMVDYNPSFFSISIVPPEMVEARVDLLSSVVKVEEIDVTGKFRKLRPALDEDVAWMADSEYVFSRYKEDVRGCAVMAFLPPRCFIFCDNEGSENDERLLTISGGLRTVMQGDSRKESVEIRPGALLVGFRKRIYMRVIALGSDVHQPTRVRCLCVDYNAIYSFERHELFNVPREFSPKNIPTNVFLGRFRGTYYVYQDKHEEVSNALCPLKNNEGTAEFAMCAIFGTAPDGLLIVDTCMGKSNEWVSEVLIRKRITAPMDDNLDVELSPSEAKKMWEKKIGKRHDKSECSDCTTIEHEDTSAKMFANERRLFEELENPPSTYSSEKVQGSINGYKNCDSSRERDSRCFVEQSKEVNSPDGWQGSGVPKIEDTRMSTEEKQLNREVKRHRKKKIGKRHDKSEHRGCTTIKYEDTSANMFANERRLFEALESPLSTYSNSSEKVNSASNCGKSTGTGSMDENRFNALKKALSSYIRTCRKSKMSPHVTAIINCMVMNTITAACRLLKAKRPDTCFEGALVNELLSESDTMITSALEEMKHLSFD